MVSGESTSRKPSVSFALSLMVVLSVGIVGCQDTPTAVLEGEVQLSVHGASSAATADAFVDDDNAGGTEDGTSWATAFGNLNDALASATDLNNDGAISIWIAGGLYVPTAVYSPGGVEGGAYGDEARSGAGIPLAQYEADRDAGLLNTFYLADGVRLYGGFRGMSGGGDSNDRDSQAFRTILSGDVDGNDLLDREDAGYRDSREDNVWHVTSAHNDITRGRGAVLLDGLTIEDGDAFDAPSGFTWAHNDGGGLKAVNNDIALNDLVVQRNESRLGGGIFSITFSPFTTSLVATYSTFHDNHAGDREPRPGNGCCGGAIYTIGDFFGPGSTALIENSTFTENTAGGGGGGAVAAASVLITVRNNHFEGNGVAHAGGAVQSRSSATKYIIEDNTFTANFAGDRSGAVDKIQATTEFQLRRNVFLNNRTDAQNGDGGGAAAIIRGGGNIIEDNHFEGNTSGGIGGAGFFGFESDGHTLLKNNTYIANRSEALGGAYVTAGGLVTSTGEIFVGNSALEAGGAVMVTAFSLPQSANISDATFDGNFAEGINSPNFDALLALVFGLTTPDPTHAGGAIANAVDGTLTIDDSNFENNYAVSGKGGAIANGGSMLIVNPVVQVQNGATLTVNNSVFNDNEARADGGGAISSERIDTFLPFLNTPVTLSVDDGHFDGNSASGDGGAVSTLNVQSLSLSKNHLSNSAALGNGGAVAADGGTISAFKDHYNFNAASGNGGALYLRGITGDLAQQHFNHNDADGLGDSMFLEGSTPDMSNIQIAGEDADDVVSVAGVIPAAALVSELAGGAQAVDPDELRQQIRERFLSRWKSRMCDVKLRQSARESATLECTIDGGR